MRTLFLIALLDAFGFGVIIPIFLYYALQLGATPSVATMFFAIYPIALMFASPFLGKLSDRIGRRPVLLLSLGGASLSYVLLGFADTLLLLGLSRLLQGFMAGNLSVVQAYVADVTDEDNRARGMGMVGAGTALGFVAGPAVGAWLGGGSFENTSLEIAAWVSAGASLAAFTCVWFFLPESLEHKNRSSQPVKLLGFNPFSGLGKAFSTPVLREFFICALLFNIAGAFAEVILPLWLKDTGLISGPRGLTYIFLCAGLVLALVQSKGIAPAAKHLGEHLMFRIGAAGYAASFVLLTLCAEIDSYAAVIVTWCLAGASMAFFFTGLQSLVSKCADPTERGSVMGAFSAISTLGRVIGPATTGMLYASIHPNAPFYFGAVLLLLVLVIGVSRAKDVPDTGEPIFAGGHGHGHGHTHSGGHGSDKASVDHGERHRHGDESAH